MNSRRQTVVPTPEVEWGVNTSRGAKRKKSLPGDHTHGTQGDPLDLVVGTEDQIVVTRNPDSTLTLSLAGAIELATLTASRLLATDVDKKTVSVSDLTAWIAGTANKVSVANDGDGSITITLPNAIQLDGATASRLLSTDADKRTASVTDLTQYIAGTADEVTVTDDTDGTITLSLPGAIKLDSATATRLLATDADKKTASTALATWLAGTTGQITVTDDGDGTASLSIPFKTGYGITYDSGGLKLKQQANMSGATNISSISATAGADTIDLATFNAALATMISEINAWKTVINNIIIKLRSAEVLAST